MLSRWLVRKKTVVYHRKKAELWKQPWLRRYYAEGYFCQKKLGREKESVLRDGWHVPYRKRRNCSFIWGGKIIGFKSSLMSLRNQWFFQCCDRKSRVACAQSFAPWQQATIEFMRCNLSYCIESLTKTPMVYSVLYFYLGELGTLLGGAKPTKAPPVATGLQQGCREIFTVLKTVSPCKNVWEPLVYTIRLTTCL